MNDGKKGKTCLPCGHVAGIKAKEMEDEIIDNLFKNVLRYVIYVAGMILAGFIIVQILIFLVDVIGYTAHDIVVYLAGI